ncbi:MAG TPA: GNAT family N-acetyltransferase [Anaerolineales bacterium]|nr:GNAT family N-acetyltransferase [Anaerolineales bacterium]
MTPIALVRPATLADAPAISAVHCSNIAGWKIWEGDNARPARYADLTPYQRWLNGGPWLDAAACQYHLKRLLNSGGWPLVAELNDRVVAAAELHLAVEPPPYSRNLNLSTLYVHRNHHGQGLGSALLQHALALAESHQCDTFTVAHAEAPGFYKRQGLKLAERWTRFQIPLGRGRAPKYSIAPLEDAPYDRVSGWAMPIGRYQNAHSDWERTRPGAVPDYEEWRHLRLERCWITVGRQRAALIFEESPQRPDAANTFLFIQPSILSEAPRQPGGVEGLTPGLFSAVRHCAAQSGFTHLHCFARSDSKLPGAVATDYRQQLFMKRLAADGVSR